MSIKSNLLASLGLVSHKGRVISKSELAAAQANPTATKKTESKGHGAADIRKPKSVSSDAGLVERNRWATVFASPASQGRERLCVSLLSAKESWSARQIISQLPSLDTDAERDRKAQAAKHGKASSIWDKAIAATKF